MCACVYTHLNSNPLILTPLTLTPLTFNPLTLTPLTLNPYTLIYEDEAIDVLPRQYSILFGVHLEPPNTHIHINTCLNLYCIHIYTCM